MAYTALEKMRQRNEARFGCDVGPMQPTLYQGTYNKFNLKSCVLRFVHERCEGLCFSAEIEAMETATGAWRGTGSAPNQIPYNMQMDINRLCFERALERFLDSGATKDAYDVYYCYLEIFLGDYSRSKHMVELLSEYEANGSSLLLKHRDHYTHSVYVFALGLAVYESNEAFRSAYNAFYGFGLEEDDEHRSVRAANHFLGFWGLTSLFHDIGYPFELPFEQVLSYFEVDGMKRGRNTPYLIYKNFEVMTRLGTEARTRFQELFGKTFDTVDELLAFDVNNKLGKTYGFTEDYLLGVLRDKPIAPERFNYGMDHGHFSALRLYRGLTDAMGIDSANQATAWTSQLTYAHVDALSAILIHNLLYKYSIAFYKDKTKPTLRKELHPLAWLLMLCDELQCWDRAAYGRNSRTQLHPMGVDFNFADNHLVARYLFDEDEQEKIDDFLERYLAWKAAGKVGPAPALKAYSDMVGDEKEFTEKILMLVDTEGMPLTIACDIAPVNRGSKHIYLSNSTFLHLHDFAVSLNARHRHAGEEKKVSLTTLESEFSELSLEYKLSNINQAKNFARYLDAIHCFYSDKPMDYDVLQEFTPEHIDRFAPMEHERWVIEHRSMGWRQGDLYRRLEVPEGTGEKAWRMAVREQTRCHALAMDDEELTSERIRNHYDSLSDHEKEKDGFPFNSMLKLVRKFDGLRIYHYSS